MAEDMGERTEAPTPRKMSEARQRGNVARSSDLAAAVDLIGAVILLIVFGASVLATFSGVLRRVLGEDMANLDASAAAGLAVVALVRGLITAAPVLGAMLVVGILSHALQFGFLFTTQPLTPDLNRLNPISGFGRLFGRRNLVKTLVSGLKLTVVLMIGWMYLSGSVEEVVALPRLSAVAGLLLVGRLALELVAWLLAVLLAIGLADFLYQKWQHNQDLRMTKSEVKDERRSMDGDPQVKSKRLRMARQIAMHRIGQSVPKADVVVTNPTHYAVALQYDANKMNAPRVVAKGADELAARIRQIAAMNQVPIVERPPLARALYAGVEVGRDVPPELYEAVAEVLAYVYRLEKQAAVA